MDVPSARIQWQIAQCSSREDVDVPSWASAAAMRGRPLQPASGSSIHACVGARNGRPKLAANASRATAADNRRSEHRMAAPNLPL